MTDAGIRARRGGWWARARVYVIPVVVLLAVTLPHLEQGDFRTDTGWYSAIGVSSVRHWAYAHGVGDLLTLQAEPGKAFFKKPPLALWIHGVVLWIFGINLAAARAPTIAAACGCVALAVGIVRRVGTRSQAMMAGMALALTLEFFRRTKEVSLDMWQLVFMLGAVYVVVRGAAVTRASARNGAASGVLIGLALLCKPLVGLLASVVLLAWIGVEARGVRRLSPQKGSGAQGGWWWWMGGHVAGVLVVASPWYVVMGMTHGREFLGQHFVGEVAERATGEMGKGTRDGHAPAWFYLKLVGETYWPWMVTMVLGVVALARRELAARARPVAVLALVWFVAWLMLLTVFPDRRPRYALVVWPAGAVLTGLWMGVKSARGLRPLVRGVAAWGAPAAVAAGVIFAALPVKLQAPPDRQWPALFEWMRANKVEELWQGSFSGPSGARVYLEFGWWPRQTQDRKLEIVERPAAGALIVYHRRDGYAPGPGEETVFHEGDLTVTRLGSAGWKPLRVADPGDRE